jgi:hypothetical protein
LSTVKTILLSPKDFFKEVVEDAFTQRRVKTFPFAKQYLISLLEGYIPTDKLYDEPSEGGKKSQKTLAELLLTANTAEASVRIDLLKRLGDTSLYVSGFFGESLQRKVVDIDYYANMGGLAYGSLSGFVKEDTYKKVYQEFAERFMDFVDILTFVSQKMMVQSDENILRLYDKYIRTGSELAKDTLLEKGINPVPQGFKPTQQ